MKILYKLEERIRSKLNDIHAFEDKAGLKRLLLVAGVANIPEFYPFIRHHFGHRDQEVVATAIEAAGHSMYPGFIDELVTFLPLKATRKPASAALENYGNSMLPLLSGLVSNRQISIASCRFIPHVMRRFESQEAIRHLFHLLEDPDLTIRLEVIRALSELRRTNPKLKFNRDKVVSVILEECKIYHQTLSAMHTQIIISYRNRKRTGKQVSEEEKDARGSLLELLERRLDAGLERIFKLLGLKFAQHDVQIAYEGLLSKKHEAQANAIEFLDTMLSGDLKRRLLPIIEESALDTSSEEVLQKIMHRIPTERECFALLLNGNDYKVKLAVLYLIKQQGDPGYISLIEEFETSDDLKIRTFAGEALLALRSSG